MNESAGPGSALQEGLPGSIQPEPRQDGRGRGDTRARIQQVAVELFTEHGYEKTSLREIAERLDVTKAALYYHFKSKEDIVASLVEDYYGQIDALLTWAQAQPRDAGTRREILRRYVGIMAEGDEVFRMLHQNQAAVNTLASAKGRGTLFRERLTGLVEVLIEPGGGTPERVRAAMALGGVSVGWMIFADQVEDRKALCATVFDVACGLVDVSPHDDSPADGPATGPGQVAVERTSGTTR
jgi:AcrR family transcriptional regulator